MTSATNRRAVLGAVLAAGAVASAPISAACRVTAASEPHATDADLFALIAAAWEMRRRTDEACAAHEALCEQAEDVSRPAALIVREEDLRYWPDLIPGEPLKDDKILSTKNGVNRRRNLHLDPKFAKELFDGLHVTDEEMAKIRLLSARESEIAAAYDQWMVAQRAAMDRCGATAAEDLYEEICAQAREAARQVANKRTLTNDGLLAKLAFILRDYDMEELNDHLFGEGTSELVLASVMRDYKLVLEART